MVWVQELAMGGGRSGQSLMRVRVLLSVGALVFGSSHLLSPQGGTTPPVSVLQRGNGGP